MKRFFCPACNRIRRARNLPAKFTKDVDSGIVTGMCAPHYLGLSRSMNQRAENPIKKSGIKKVAAPTIAKSSSKKGRK